MFDALSEGDSHVHIEELILAVRVDDVALFIYY
jgi:hypothetical protein